MRNLLITLLVLIAVFFGLHSPAEANLLSDPGFENGGGAIALRDGPWTWSGGDSGDSFYDPALARSGSKSAKTVMWGSTATNYAYYVETFSGIDFSVPYTMSGYFMSNSAAPLKNGATAQFEVKWMNSLGQNIRIDRSTAFTNAYAIDTWHQISMTTAAPPPGTVEVAAVMALLSNTAYAPESAVFTDDLSFDVVPEPSSIMLLGCGLVGLIALGKRKMK